MNVSEVYYYFVAVPNCALHALVDTSFLLSCLTIHSVSLIHIPLVCKLYKSDSGVLFPRGFVNRASGSLDVFWKKHLF